MTMPANPTYPPVYPIRFTSPEGNRCFAKTVKDHRSMLSLEGWVVKPCGMLWGMARVGCDVDSGWATGEYGERMSKKEAMELAQQMMGAAGDKSPHITITTNLVHDYV